LKEDVANAVALAVLDDLADGLTVALQTPDLIVLTSGAVVIVAWKLAVPSK